MLRVAVSQKREGSRNFVPGSSSCPPVTGSLARLPVRALSLSQFGEKVDGVTSTAESDMVALSVRRCETAPTARAQVWFKNVCVCYAPHSAVSSSAPFMWPPPLSFYPRVGQPA